jgi:uncharacterized protein YfdQ (DUF2303 family)
MIDSSAIDAVAALAQESVEVRLLTAQPPDAEGDRIFAVVPKGHDLKDITDSLLKSLPVPQHRTGLVELLSLASFSEFTARMAEPSSVLFADKANRCLVCVFDYHDAVNAPADAAAETQVTTEAVPRWGRFRAVYKFPVSEPWKRWSGNHKHAMTQSSLAEWIEENIADVLDPADLKSLGQKQLIGELGLKLAGRSGLLVAARGLDLTATETVAQAVNTSSGETEIRYAETHTSGGQPAGVSVPSAFLIGLPVFEGGEWYQLLVRLRYRKAGGSLQWSYDVYNLDKALDDALTSSCETVRNQVKLPLFFATNP